MNSKQQGDIGVSAAILYYTKLGYGVSYPLTDNLRYDLVVDKNGTLLRVQCKTSRYRQGTGYAVSLATSGGNQSWAGVRKMISQQECDIVFVWCGNDSLWEVPSSHLDGKSSFKACAKNKEFLVQGELICPPKESKKYSCSNCGSETTRVKSSCKNCFSRAKKIDWPELDKLQADVLEFGCLEMSRRLGVSDTAIRKHLAL